MSVPYTPSDPSQYPDPSPSIPRPAAAPVKKKKRPVVQQAYPAMDERRKETGGIGTIVKKDSLGRVMNTMAPIEKRGGSGSAAAAVRGGVDDGSGGSGLNAPPQPYTKDDVVFDFSDVPDETTWRYLELQNLLPTFDGGSANPFNPSRALNPKLLYDTPAPPSIPSSSSPAPVPQKKKSRPSKRDRDESQATEDAGAEKEPKKRRLTNTSMSAAAVLVPLTDIAAAGGRVEEAVELNGAAVEKDKPAEPTPMDGVEATEPAASAVPAAPDQGATEPPVDPNDLPQASTDDPIIPPESPPALRRSTRRPPTSNLPRSRSSSPSESTLSDDEVERRRFKPILADVEAVRRGLREKAEVDWFESLKAAEAGGGVGGIQVVGMQMGQGGVPVKRVVRESEVVVEFLYALKTADRTLKIANQPPSQAMLDMQPLM